MGFYLFLLFQPNITSIRLNKAHQVLINGKLRITPGVINLTQIKNWNLVKGESKWISGIL